MNQPIKTKKPASSTIPAPTGDDAKKVADAILRIDISFKAFLTAGLNQKAIITLLHDYTGVGKRDIERVLKGCATLANEYLSKKTKA